MSFWRGELLKVIARLKDVEDQIPGLQPLNGNLTSWAAITRAAGFDTFAGTPSSANLRALLSDETGTGAAVFATSPTLVTPVLGVASATSLALAGALTGATTGAFSGDVTVGTIAAGGGVLPANTKVQGYASSNSLQIIARLENDNGVSPIAALGFVVTSSGGETRSAKAGFGLERNSANGRGHLHFYNRITNDTSDFTSSDVYARANVSGQFDIVRCFGRGSPIVKTADFTVAITENWLVNNKAAANCTVTLPAASSFPGREIMISNRQAFTVISASSNVVPLAGGAAGTAILAAVAGRWATLVSDGTNWLIMQAA